MEDLTGLGKTKEDSTEEERVPWKYEKEEQTEAGDK